MDSQQRLVERVEGMMGAAGLRVDESTRKILQRYRDGELKGEEAIQEVLDIISGSRNLSA